MIRVVVVCLITAWSPAVAAEVRKPEDDARSIDDPRVQHLTYESWGRSKVPE